MWALERDRWWFLITLVMLLRGGHPCLRTDKRSIKNNCLMLSKMLEIDTQCNLALHMSIVLVSFSCKMLHRGKQWRHSLINHLSTTVWLQPSTYIPEHTPGHKKRSDGNDMLDWFRCGINWYAISKEGIVGHIELGATLMGTFPELQHYFLRKGTTYYGKPARHCFFADLTSRHLAI